MIKRAYPCSHLITTFLPSLIYTPLLN
ncbi:MAG: hypothetical protein J6Y04_07325 [Bacteroidaceae bacterium]|nr:hypothetical protein [Bacteroidaceae bacterium]